MTEQEYIIATNLAKARAALLIVNDILPGDKWGVDHESWRAVSGALREWMEQTDALIEIDQIGRASCRERV